MILVFDLDGVFLEDTICVVYVRGQKLNMAKSRDRFALKPHETKWVSHALGEMGTTNPQTYLAVMDEILKS